jgi:hypothetical protein
LRARWRLEAVPGHAATRRFDERRQVEAEASDLALFLHPPEPPALEDVRVEQVEVAQVAAKRVVVAGVAQAERLERRYLAVFEGRLELLEQEAEAVEELLVVEVGAA